MPGRHTLPDDLARHRVLSSRDAAEFIGLSIADFRRKHWAGQLPRAIKLGERRLGWVVSDLITWVEQKKIEAAKGV